MSHWDVPSNFAKDIEQAAGGEAIEGIVLSPERSHSYFDDNSTVGAVLTWDQARLTLDYDYDTGYGGADCHAITAWTASRVLFVHEYDGSTCVVSVPRNPTPGVPQFH